MNRFRVLSISALLIIVGLLYASTAFADEVDNAVQWMLGQQVANGSWGEQPTSFGNEFQTTTEVLETLSILNPGTEYAAGIAWLSSQPADNTDYLSRKLFVLSNTGAVTDLQTSLVALQGASGGWGIDGEFVSDLLDTSLALRALSHSQYGNFAVLQGGLNYLLNNVNTDGGVGRQSGDASHPYYTALYLLALYEYQKFTGLSTATAINAACQWLSAAQNTDGGWGTPAGSSATETGLAVYAMVLAGCDFNALAASSYLLSTQQTDGSWNGDAYGTALAVRALPFISRPNLVFGLEDVGFTPELPIPGESVSIAAAVQNIGRVDASNVAVRFYEGDPANGGILIGLETIADLSAGGSASVSMSASWPDVGTRDIYVVLDPDNLIPEVSEADNQSIETLFVVEPAPDLAIDSTNITFNPVLPNQGQSFTIQASVRNAGHLPADNVAVRFFNGDPGAGGTVIGTDQVISSLAAGASTTVQMDHTIAVDGSYSIFVQLDPGNLVTEAREDNNQASAIVNVQPLPDLAVSTADLEFIPPNPGQSKDFIIQTTVRNIGGLNSPAFDLFLYNGNPTAGGVQIAGWNISSLGAGGSITVQTNYSIAAAGAHDIYAVVDTTNAVTEAGEANNQAFNTVNITPLPDLQVSASSITSVPAFPKLNENFVLQVNVQNAGAADADNVLVRIFNGDPDSGGSQIGSDQTIMLLAAGASEAVEVSYSSDVEGQYDFYVQVDPLDSLFEIDESNNSASRSVWLSQTTPFQWSDSFIIAIDDQSRLYYAKSNGDGSFADYRQIWQLGGGNARAVVIEDFDGDGNLDFIAGTGIGSTAYFYRFINDGGDNFTNTGLIGTLDGANSWAMNMAAGDFNEDGRVDFIANTNAANTGVFVANADGTFTKSELNLGGAGRGTDVADFNNDGNLDFARARWSDGQAFVYLGNGDGTFGDGILVGDAGNDPYGLVAADFDNDGTVDLVINAGGNGNPFFFQGNGDGTFTSLGYVASLDLNNYSAYDGYDLNTDGNVDVVAVNYSGRRVRYYPGNGDGTFGTPVEIGVTVTNTLDISAPPYRLFGAPYAVVDPSEQVVALGGTANFNGSGSTDSDNFGTIASWGWDFGDGTTGAGEATSHAYGSDEANDEGVYPVALTVTDNDGLTGTTAATVVVQGAAPVADAGGPYVFGETAAQLGIYTVTLDGSASTDLGGIVSYEWDLGDGWSDNFDDGDANGWAPQSGTWGVAAGRYEQTDINLDRAITTTGRIESADYSFSADVEMLNGTGQEAILVFRSTEGNNRYELLLRGRNLNDLVLFRTQNGTNTTLVDYNLPSPVALNTVYRLGVEVKGQTIRVYLNDSLAFTASDATFSHGQVGLATYRTHARFDNVILESKGTGQTVNHQYGAGSYTATLTVTDKAGQQHTDTALVTVQPGEIPTANAGADVTLNEADASDGSWRVDFDATASTDDVGIALYEWDFGDGTTATGQNVQHVFTPDPADFPLVQYIVTLTVTDNALQTSTTQVLVTIDLSANTVPVADGGGDYLVGEEAANAGEWSVFFDASGSSDAEGIQRYEWTFGDGGSLTTWWAKERHNFMEAGTSLYGYDVPDAALRIIGTQPNTRVRIINLETGEVVKSNTLNRYTRWTSAAPGDGIYFKVDADKPVLGYLTDNNSHTTFIPSLDNGPVGREFIFEHRSAQGFFIYAIEDAVVQIFNTSEILQDQRLLAAGSYWSPTLSNGALYHIKASGNVAMQNVGNNGYTTVPAITGDGAGQTFYFATQQGSTGALAVFAHADAEVNLYNLDTNALVATQTISAGDFWYQNGLGANRFRLEATADVEVWAGDTEGGTGIQNLGDDISFAGGKNGTLFHLHGLMDGAVIFAMHDGTQVDVDGAVTALNADQFMTLPGGAKYRVASNLPVVIQTLGRANTFNDLGTYLGGMSQVKHGYSPDLTVDEQVVFNASLTVYDEANQSARDDFLVTVTRSDGPQANAGGPYAVGEGTATGGSWRAEFDASSSSDDVGIYRYEWDFDVSDGIQVDATGVTTSHNYAEPGTYTVTLRVYDNALQVSETTTQVVVSFGNPPVADAGGPYVFGEESASFGVWTATLDGTGSSDDSGLFDFNWAFELELVDDFNDDVLDETVWTSAGASEVGGRLTVDGVSNWSARGFYSNETFSRTEGIEFRGQVFDAGSGNRHMMWGVFKGAPSSYHYNQMHHAIYFNNGNLNIYEDGSHRGSVGSYQADVLYDVRIVLKAAGADYFIRPAGSSDWTQLTNYSSLNRTGSPLRIGASVYSVSWQFDDQSKQLTLNGPIVSRTHTEIGVHGTILTVRDNALQPDSDATTYEIKDGLPPVADAGGDYTVEVGSFLQFNGTASTDDVAIQTYDWVFGDSTGGAADLPFTGKGATPRHFYKEVGTYTAELTVTDNTLKSHSDTATVNVVIGNPPLATGQVVADGAANGPPVYFNAEASSDDYGIVEYRWDFDADIDRDGDGDPTNDIDAVGAKPFHTYSTATTPATTILGDDFNDGTITGWTTNGTVVEDSGLLQITGANWGAGYAFTNQSFDRAGLRLTGEVYTPSSGHMMVGIKNNNTSSGHYNQLHHAIYFNNGSLNIYEDGSHRGGVGSYTRGDTYEVRIDIKAAGADYYIRPLGSAAWTPLTSFTSLNRVNTPLRIGIDAHSGVWGFDNIKLEGTGPKVVTLTVEDGAGQTDSTQFQLEVAPNLPPNVITVPWVAHDPLAPHETYNGKAIRLKGIVRDADAQTFQWDFGDGSQSPVTNISNTFDLSVTHTYPDAANGTPFVATLKVWDSLGQMGQDTYNIVVKPKTLNTETNIAIDEGLWYLHQQQTRTTAEGYDTGYWTSGARASATASSIQSFLINTHLETVDPQEDPYQETVLRGMRQLFRDLGTVDIATQTYGEPDTNGNNIGIETGVNSSGGRPIYQGGQVMDAIASTGTPLARAITGGNGIKRRSYFDILTDMSDQFAWGQTEQGSGGGWRYSWNSSIDNSAAQWGAIGILAAEDIFGIPVPQWVKDRNLVWLNRSYSGTGWGYTSGISRVGTPSGLVQMVFDDQTQSDAKWKTAEKWIADTWTSQYITNPGNRPYYALYALTKAMRLAKPEPVVQFSSNGFDWFNDPVTGLARTLIDDQLDNGQFPGSEWISGQLRSAWGVIMLSQTLFVQPPVANAGRDRVWAVDLPLAFDGSGSFHLDPFRSLVKYEWDFNGDGIYDSSSSEPTATYTYPLSEYPEDTLPQTVTATLRVTDNNVPPLTDTDTVNIVIAIPPHPPVAEAGGPYTCTQGLACQLDGSGSFDIDPTDFIARYEWELDSVFPFDFDEATGATPAPVFDTQGTLNIGLRVWDNGVLNDLDGDGEVDENERLSDQHFTQVTVVKNEAPVAVVDGPLEINEGSTITLDGSSSSDPNGDPLSYAWDLDNDGQYDDATGLTPNFVGVDDGGYTIGLQVTDSLLDSTASTTVTVLNVAPTVEAGPDQEVEEGTIVQFNGSFVDPGTQDTHTIEWDFGDGNTASGSLTPSHIYPDEGVFTVTLTVTDDDGGVGTDTLTVTVGNAAPVVEAGADKAIEEGGSITLDPATFTDAGVNDTHTATVDWGDGTPVVPGTVTESNGSGTVDTGHTYAEDGEYVVTVTVTDSDGASGSDTFTVTVGNLPPVVEAGAIQAINEGDGINLDPATFTDPGINDTHTATIDWGDGSPVEDGTVTESNGSGTVNGSHTYTTPGTYTVTITVTDDEGASGFDTFIVQVGSDVDLIPNPGGPYTVDEGSSVPLDASGSTGGVTGYAWDLDNDGQYDDAMGVTATFNGVDDGVYTIGLQVTNGAQFDTAITTISVVNVAPTVEAGAEQTVDLGNPVNLDPATFSDPGVLDTHTSTINWGDGSVEPGTLTGTNGSGSVAGSHTYTTAGTYTVTVTVTDDDGGVGTDVFTVIIQDVSPPEQTIFDLTAYPKDGKIDIAWSPVAGAQSYNIYRATTAGGSYSLIAQGVVTDFAAYADLGLTNGVTYYYVVKSVTNGVESLYSNEASGTPISGRTR